MLPYLCLVKLQALERPFEKNKYRHASHASHLIGEAKKKKKTTIFILIHHIKNA